ncbi:phospholipase D-like domain-containing protein [Natranaeroarchaeum aerophilus]|uniref:Phosphatidylserine/phosphatidylglycerophosphate/ cardiolipin synthase family protein n=1 Tax=Natranaeroarchaeum aerophilus TaxID=2917711 RepID=A0AAE3FSH8_9EURY|nr:phosphatidylserine/phosphatidylglycerophosphate/cardiolipin synthase family protein [Natranaeroarchaeum aerophilus]MCL9814356.1 phosphatidylserine/phosphatidylglycerophosphate/cardiolipin synthase family protein [Natranaeroarchaeum aerophilus]
MDVKSIAHLSDNLQSLGVPPRMFGAVIEYCAGAVEGGVTVDAISDELGVSRELTRTVLKRLVLVDALALSEEDGVYKINYNVFDTVIERIHWFSSMENQDAIDSILTESPAEIEVVTSSPSGIEGIPHSSITGRMIEMIAGASERVVVVNPFFTDGGLDLLLDAFVAATARGVSLRMITRDIEKGDQSNADDIGRLASRIRDGGQLEKFSVFEIDTTAFQDASLHAKAMVVDSHRSYVGSANLTNQSLQNAVEMGLYLEGVPVEQINSYLEQCCNSDLFCSVDIESVL